MNLESSARRGDRGEIRDGAFLGKIHRGQPLGPGDVIPRERMGPPLPSVPTLHCIIQLSGDQILVPSVLAARGSKETLI